MAGKFECYKDKAGEFRFRLKAGNGETILSSEGYKSKASCKKGIESVRKNGVIAERFVAKTTASGKHRFNLMASNGQVIGVSQNYESAASCENGCQAVGRAAPDATVDDQT